MDFGRNGFEELEPRATPQPTILKCMTDPSVPEVSLVFGKPYASQSPTTSSNIPEDKCRAYATWRTAEFPSAMSSRPINQESPNRYSSTASPKPTNANPSNSPNFWMENTTRNASTSSSPMRNSRDQPSIQKNCYSSAPIDNRTDCRSGYSSEQQFHHETAFASPRKHPVATPLPNGSYNTVRSILKSSLSNSGVGRPSSDGAVRSEGDFRCKTPSQSNHHHKTRRYTDSTGYAPASPVSRCQHTSERNHESDTVRDLLLLVKNQNEQIKSLQSQVERLLEIHERNIECLENRRSKPSEKSQSSRTHDTENLVKNNLIASTRSRGIDVTSLPGEQQEVSTRCQSDPRNTIMEKKVSIGVMTSFEFSVQNNPFMAEEQSSDTLRDCGQNARTSDAWSPRNVPTGVLENISEDTESHLSSMWKQSSNNTQLSDKLASRRSPYGNDNRAYIVKDATELSPEALQIGNNRNDSLVTFPTKSFENSQSCKNRVSELSNKRIENSGKPEVRSPNNRLERNENFTHRQADLNHYDRTAALESSNDYNSKNTKRGIHCYSERSNGERISIPPENTADGSLVLCSSDFQVPDRSLISLDPSIHVEMREYSSDDENEDAKRTPAVGWTFYKNVVGQVNRILHSMPGGQDVDENEKINPMTFHNEVVEKKDILNSVKSATLEQLKMLGISYAEHSQFNGEHPQKKVTFDSSYRPSVDCQMQNLTQQSTNSIGETNTSMHMKTLALKYLSDEQLADLAVHKQGVGAAMKHKFLSVQGTNMSFATMNYLQRYCLVTGMQTVNGDGKGPSTAARQKKHLHVTKESQSPIQNQSFESSVNREARDNILDITTLKQQPKLL